MSTLKLSAGTLKQSTFDMVGDGKTYDELKFLAGAHTINTPIELNSGTTLSAEADAWIYLQKNVALKTFPSQTPLFGQTGSTIKDIVIDGLNINGNGANQLSETGDGFHNCFGFKGCSNIEIKNMQIKDTLGDGARLTNATGVYFYKNNIYQCGHDGLYVDGGSNIQAYNNTVGLRTNSAVRIRHAKNAKIYNNTIKNVSGGLGTGPGIQLEVSSTSGTLSDITVENNTFQNTYAPGIWAICRLNTSTNAAKGLTIRGNTFSNCGLMTSQLSGTGGIACDGITDVLIEKNVFENCKGYAVLFGQWVKVSSAGSGYKATVRYNKISGQTAGIISGTATGTAIANLLPAKYTVTAYGNTFNNNVRNLYNVTEISDPGDSEEDTEDSNETTDTGAVIECECPTSSLETIKKIAGAIFMKK